MTTFGELLALSNAGVMERASILPTRSLSLPLLHIILVPREPDLFPKPLAGQAAISYTVPMYYQYITASL